MPGLYPLLIVAETATYKKTTPRVPIWQLTFHLVQYETGCGLLLYDMQKRPLRIEGLFWLIANPPVRRRKLRDFPFTATAMTSLHIRPPHLPAVLAGNKSFLWPGQSVRNIRGQTKSNCPGRPPRLRRSGKADYCRVFSYTKRKPYRQNQRRPH